MGQSFASWAWSRPENSFFLDIDDRLLHFLTCSDGCETVWVAFKLRINRANWFQLWWLWRLRRPWRLLTTLTTLRIFKVANSKRNQNKKKKKKFMANSTQCSQAVSHPSTNRAQHCLTSVIGRELVYSMWYGRCREKRVKWARVDRQAALLWG